MGHRDKESGDPVFDETGTTPLGIAHPYRTHDLLKVGPSYLKLQPRLRTRVHGTALSAIGIAGIVTPLVLPMPRPAFTMVVGVALAVYGVWFYAKETTTFTIDAHQGLVTWSHLRSSSTPLSNVHALQLLAFRIDGFDTLELNVILRSAERVHLLSHSGSDEVRSQAHTLAELLNVPVWSMQTTRRRVRKQVA